VVLDPPEHHRTAPAKVAHHKRQRTENLSATGPDYEVPPTTETEAEVEPDPQPQEASSSQEEDHQEPVRSQADPERAPIDEAVAATPSSESGATEYTEAPSSEPVESTAPAPSTSSGGSSGSSSSGSAAGEFGP
jgi:hypothetical protein